MPTDPAAAETLAALGLTATEPTTAPEAATEPTEPAEPAAPTEPAVPEVPAEESAVPDPAGANNPDAYQKAIAAERKTAREANARARELQAALEAERTAALPLADQLAQATTNETTALLAAARYEVAAEVGLDLKLASRLQGTTAEELKADAQALLAQVGATAAAPTPTVPPEGGFRTDPPAKKDPGKEHSGLILGLLKQRVEGTPAGTTNILAGLEPAPTD